MTANHVDLRSDTVTRPSAAMREVMASADVGDDVYGEDPTVNHLEAMGAELTGNEAAVFACSGTQSNLLALMSHCGRGDEYIVGQQAHTYRFEGGGAAVLGSIQPQPLDFRPDGTLDLAAVAAAIKPDDFHFARTRLLCLENTQSGKVLPLDYLARARALTLEHALKMHLDGARVFNAAVKLSVPVVAITRHFDSVSICLSKGLGAPLGSLLCGDKDFVHEARRLRKMVGGGMRQVGVVAAAGIYALSKNVERLAEDHDNARRLADGLSAIDELSLDRELVQTNMVFVRLPAGREDALRLHLKENGVLIAHENPLRIVTHLDISKDDIDRVVRLVKSFFRSH
jgi:threonine aldolase